MIQIEDLSFSKIVDLIQHDNKKGADMLVQIATEKEKIDKLFLEAEIRVQQIKTRQLELRKGALGVLKHLKRETPLAVKCNDFIVVVSDTDITIERNVL
jgi:hypothetical protein